MAHRIDASRSRSRPIKSLSDPRTRTAARGNEASSGPAGLVG